MRRQISKRASRWTGVGFACLALLMVTASLLSSQEVDKASGSAQPIQRDYRFEVASIRPTKGRGYGSMHPYSPGHYRDEDISLSTLAFKAFSIKHSYLFEYPQWMASTFFTVNATLPPGATKADLPIMIQHLLEDRFGLVFHHDMRHVAGYKLVVAKSGRRFAESTGPPPDKSMVKGPDTEIGKDGMPQFTKDARSGELYFGSVGVWRGRNETMKELASSLAEKLDGPVLDATGLEGEYDFMLTFTDEDEDDRSTSGVDEGLIPLEHPLLRDALQEQLGLKLDSAKDVPVDVVVVDKSNHCCPAISRRGSVG